MIVAIKRLFYSSPIGELYFRYLLWQDHRKFRKEIKNLDLSVQQILINRTSELYREGIGQIKRKVNNLVASKNKDEYDKTLKGIENLVGLAGVEGDRWSKEVDMIYQSYVRKGGTDIKNDTEMAKMVEERIQHYKDLHRFKQERELVKQIRKAKEIGDSSLATQLQEEWQSKYGRFKKSRRP